MKEPKGVDLLKTLIELYAEQEGVKIKYVIEEKGANNIQSNDKSRKRIKRIWHDMRTRCNNPNHNRYKFYGGRGISVCDEWNNNFQAFYDWAKNSGYTDNLSIDRMDINGNYEPSNCRWATQKEQQNNRTNNRLITFNGETRNLTQWGIYTGIGVNALHLRLMRGWSIEKALTTQTRIHQKKERQGV